MPLSLSASLPPSSALLLERSALLLPPREQRKEVQRMRCIAAHLRRMPPRRPAFSPACISADAPSAAAVEEEVRQATDCHCHFTIIIRVSPSISPPSILRLLFHFLHFSAVRPSASISFTEIRHFFIFASPAFISAFFRFYAFASISR
jgi:hypothetical protein